jgi:hypothetical protein
MPGANIPIITISEHVHGDDHNGSPLIANMQCPVVHETGHADNCERISCK